MNIDWATQFAKDWVNAWNSHDIDKIVSHYACELEFKSPLILARFPESSGVINDRNKLKEYFLIGLTQNPDLRFELLDLLLGTDSVTLYYKNARGGQTAEFFEFDSQGRVIRSISCYSSTDQH